ncbi:MAG: IS110 family transposase [Candidatus Brocadia sp. UTAMX2]|jgi:transposase|nr:MAG: IS110 family transposase [Candidatus Brocadia sp. UTAMX2]
MRYFVGIDLHSDNSYVGVIDKNDSRIFGKKLPNDLGLILKELKPFQTEIEGIVVESTYNWYWLVDGLQAAKYKVHLANPAEMQQYSGMKYTDDTWDSYWLAHLLRLGMLPEGYIYPKEIRLIRDLLRKRTMLVRHRTAHILSLQNMVNRNTGKKVNVNDAKRLSEEKISEQLTDEHHKMAVQSDKAVIDFFHEQIDRIEEAVLKEVKLRYPYEELLTVPGIGTILGITIMLETGDINRFPTVSDYSSYCRCVSSQKISNGKKKGEGNKKNGNKYLAWTYVEAANFMRRYSEPARSWHQRKAAKTNKIVAIKALSNKVARACYFIIKDQTPFDPKKLFQ